MSGEVYMNELKSSTKETLKTAGKILAVVAGCGALIYFCVFATGCATAYNVNTELREIQVVEPLIVRPAYEKIDFKQQKDGVFIDNANVCKLVRNEKKHVIYEDEIEDRGNYYKGVIMSLGGVFDETK